MPKNKSTAYCVFSEDMQKRHSFPPVVFVHKFYSGTLWHSANKIWIEGPRGGVKVVKDRESNMYGYVTNNEEEMKAFMWAKLQAVEVSVIKSNLTEIDALMLESKLIDIFGIIATGGNLVNLDEGINNKERQMLYKDALCELNDVFKNSV